MSAAEQTVCITGCTRGLGLAMVREFAGRGYAVAGCGRSREQIDALNAEFASPHRFYAADTADDASVGAFAAGVLAEVGTPRLLLNNAALINANAPLWEVGHEEFSRVVDVNIKGVHSVIRHFLPAMLDERRGVIVNFSSGWGRSTSPEVAPYCATKWAIEGLTRALAQELPAGMAAVALNPGIINTEMLQSCMGASADSYPDPEEWARSAVPFLIRLSASDNGAALTAP